MQRYESYKASGVEWLGEIPSHWKIRKIKFVAKINENTLPEKTAKDSEIRYVDISSVSQGSINKVENFSFSNAPSRARRLAKVGDTIISTVRTYLKAISIVDEYFSECVYSTGFCVLSPCNQFKNKYFAYYCQCNFFIEQIVAESKGVSFPAILASELSNLPILLPPRAEQDRIVNFLDHKTAEIEAAIAKKQRLIELLQEQKSILINQAVTRGLNTNVPMRESGVEWIGEIPAHWKIIPNRYLFREQNARSLKGEETHLSMSQRYGLIPAKELDSQTLQSESYDGAKLCMTGDLVQNRLKAHLAVFAVAPCDGLVSPDYSVFRLQNRENSPIFFERLFKTPIYLSEFNRRVRGIVVGFLRLYSDDFNAIPALVPPQEEQLSIVKYINQLNADFGTMQEKIETEIGLLTEFKTTVIASVVTGIVKV